MSNQAKHTPTPWTTGPNGIDIRDADENNITTVPYSDDSELAEANADHIVHCVNLHDELVQMVGQLKSYIPAMYVDSGHPLQRKVDDLLAKAKGGAV